MTGEVSSLEHEIGDDTVEGAASVSLFASQSSDVNERHTNPFCPVHNSRKFLAVLGTTSSYSLLYQSARVPELRPCSIAQINT